MYIKLFGAAAALAACLMAGNQYYMCEKNRYNAIKSCRIMLSLIRSELSTSSADISIILKNICGRLSTPAHGFALLLTKEMDMLGQIPFQDIWDKALVQCFAILGQYEKNIIKELGGIIGKYELEQQLEALDCAVSRLSDEEKCCYEQLKPRQKLSFGLSGAMGLMLIIVLI